MSLQWSLLFFTILLVESPHASWSLRLPVHKQNHHESHLKSAVFHSPKFVLAPGSVQNKYYFGVDFPRGHIGIKEFDAEVIDEEGNSIPLHETYLHHWVLVRYYENVKFPGDRKKIIMARNDGVCQKNVLGQYYGLGSETRRTETRVPDPYGIEVGNLTKIPEGYEEKWMLNVHAIDTRGVKNRMGCIECRCNLYNITTDEYGRPIAKNYHGGLLCCYDGTRCKSRDGFEGGARGLYLKYKVKWEDWNDAILPVKVYIFDVTDTGKPRSDFHGTHNAGCQVEYNVETCKDEVKDNGCIDSKRATMVVPQGGHVIYGVAHQHAGGIGSALYGQDGRVICSSLPIYGHGSEAGNESGYIVGMTTCYPQPGSIQVAAGEKVTLESNYSSAKSHTGVMGLFYILVADRSDVTSGHVET